MKPHAQLHLPPLSAAEALRAVAILERAIAAIWRAHGDAMADELALLGVQTPQPPDAIYVGNPAADPDAEF
jgi:hypothetical protein